MSRLVSLSIALLGVIIGGLLGFIVKQMMKEGISLAFNFFQIISYILYGLTAIFIIIYIIGRIIKTQTVYMTEELIKKIYNLIAIFLVTTFFTFFISLIVLFTIIITACFINTLSIITGQELIEKRISGHIVL